MNDMSLIPAANEVIGKKISDLVYYPDKLVIKLEGSGVEIHLQDAPNRDILFTYAENQEQT